MFETPYFDMWLAENKKFFRNLTKRPTVLHRQTCPICNRKLVNTYYSSQAEKYMCKKCLDEYLQNRSGNNAEYL